MIFKYLIYKLLCRKTGNKRSHDAVEEMEIDVTASSKRVKGTVKDQEVVDLDHEESINQEEIGKGIMIHQEDPDQNVSQEDSSSSKQIVSQFVLKFHQSSVVWIFRAISMQKPIQHNSSPRFI